MEVIMLVSTRFNGQALTVGDAIDVTSDVASRWETKHIAQIIVTEDEDKTPVEIPIERMTTAQLTEKALELGVDISSATTNAQRVDLIKAFLQTAEEE